MSMIKARQAERGFTLIELLVSMVVTVAVVGGAAVLTSQVQASYTRQLEEAAAQQEGRYALEWISRLLRTAANNPTALPWQNITPTTPVQRLTSSCPAANTPFMWLVPGANSIRIQTDSYPPDGLLGGAAGACNQANEDVTISYDANARSITFLDNNLGGAASIRTDAVIDGLNFVYRNGLRQITADPDAVMYIETQVRVRTRTVNPATGLPFTRTFAQEVRIRGRNCC
jgi:type II secretory pathway pseudopilin PulG